MGDQNDDKQDHAVALWAAIAAFFGSLASFTLIDLLTPGDWAQGVAALFTGLIAAGGVYSHERLVDAKQERERREHSNKPDT